MKKTLPLNQVGRVLAVVELERTAQGVAVAIQGQTLRASWTLDTRDAEKLAGELLRVAQEPRPGG